MSVRTIICCDTKGCVNYLDSGPGLQRHDRERLKNCGWVRGNGSASNPIITSCGRLDFCPACWERIKREREGAK